ncbi:MAG TPA: NAD-dependent epimerase/dehydratase family protein [Kiritimatiellia bacterium]|nr:NAD-dependent epimerase/dehydratase family protein [Kiritimatiellia bacterium]
MAGRYLITGGCGFIGSHLAEALVGAGAVVRVLDNLSSGRRENIAAVSADVELIEADVRDADAVRRAASGMDGIFHEAALVSVFDSVARPRDNHDINGTGTLNVVLAAREEGVGRIVFASTAAVYGNDPELPKRETMRPCPESPYAVAKLSGEHYLRIARSLYGLETVALRYFNVFGPRQDPRSPYSGVVSRFVDCLRSGAPPVIFGDGLQSRDFVFVRDVVQANLRAMQVPGGGHGEVFNVASGRTATLRDLLAALARLAGREMNPVCEAARPGDIRHSAAAIDRARAILGYTPAFDLEAGLRELLMHENLHA